MTLYYVKLIAIILAVLACTIATYTDIRYQIIPNWLTFTVGIVGLILGIYYYLNSDVRLIIPYLFTILLVYILSYLLWHVGLWAGGDVKLFTALSTLFVREYMDILPLFKFSTLVFPVYIRNISPIFDLIFNSVLSVLPLILLIVIFEIIRNKIYLIKDVVKSINLIDIIIIFNALMLFTIIDNILDTSVVIKFIILLLISYLNRQISGNDNRIIIIISAITLVISIFMNLYMLYMMEFITISFIYMIRTIITSGIISKALRDYVKIDELDESMVLGYDLCFDGKKYCFDKRSIKEKITSRDNLEVIVSTKASGLSMDDIKLIQKLHFEGLLNQKHIIIKKTLSFGPFILAGLIVTLTIGDIYLAILQLGRLIL